MASHRIVVGRLVVAASALLLLAVLFHFCAGDNASDHASTEATQPASSANDAAPEQLTAEEVALLKEFCAVRKVELKRDRPRGRNILSVVALADKEARQSIEHPGDLSADDVGYVIDRCLLDLTRFKHWEEAESLATYAIANHYETWAIYYYRGLAWMGISAGRYAMDAEDDFAASLKLIKTVPDSYLFLSPSIWDVHLAMAKCRYARQNYIGMHEAYMAFVEAENVHGFMPKRNPLCLDWDTLSFSAKLRRMKSDLGLDGKRLKESEGHVFFVLIQASDQMETLYGP